jgi:hypothetical protein
LDIQLRLAINCFKSNILDKQFFAVKILSNIEKRTRCLDNSPLKERLAKLLKEEGIFTIIIKGHHSLITKCQFIFRILFSEDIVSREELNELWEKVVKADIETKNSLLSLLKEVILDFSHNEVIFLLDKM